jgi:hypothetical protein
MVTRDAIDGVGKTLRIGTLGNEGIETSRNPRSISDQSSKPAIMSAPPGMRGSWHHLLEPSPKSIDTWFPLTDRGIVRVRYMPRLMAVLKSVSRFSSFLPAR